MSQCSASLPSSIRHQSVPDQDTRLCVAGMLKKVPMWVPDQMKRPADYYVVLNDQIVSRRADIGENRFELFGALLNAR